MNKVLVDTSVWIDALTGRKTWQAELLGKLIDDNAAIVLCPTIIQEILQGIRDESDLERVKDNLEGFEVLDIDPVEAAYGAADLYRKGRKQGITIRKSNDCLIAFYAISCKTTLLHNDGDFDKIAKFTSLKVLDNEPGH